MKNIFIIFKGLSVTKICLRPESAQYVFRGYENVTSGKSRLKGPTFRNWNKKAV